MFSSLIERKFLSRISRSLTRTHFGKAVVFPEFAFSQREIIYGRVLWRLLAVSGIAEVIRLGNRYRHLGSNLKNPLSGEGSLSAARASAKTRGLLVTYVDWRSKALVRYTDITGQSLPVVRAYGVGALR